MLLIRATLTSLLAVFLLSNQSFGITLKEFLDLAEREHPFILQEKRAYSAKVENERSAGAIEDTLLSVGGSLAHTKGTGISTFESEKSDVYSLSTSFSRQFASTGGTASLSLSNSYTDQALPNTTFNLGLSKYFVNALAVTYSHPLLKNNGGVLSRLEMDVAKLNTLSAKLHFQESIESFRLRMANHFLEWALLEEQQQIALNRQVLAERSYEQTNRKFRSSIVTKVDLLRARDAAKLARQQYVLAASALKAKKVELSILVDSDNIREQRPSIDIYAIAVPENNEHLLEKSRQLQLIDAQIASVERQKEAIESMSQANLSLDVTGTLKGADKELGKSLSLDKTDYSLSLNYSHPLEATKEKADLRAINHNVSQIESSRANQLRTLRGQAANIHIQLSDLATVMQLNTEQVKLAEEKTREELRFYNQGRSQLSFLIQAQDSEQNSLLQRATNAIRFHQLRLQYAALLDDLKGATND